MSVFSKPVYNNIKYPQPQYNNTSPVYGYHYGYPYGASAVSVGASVGAGAGVSTGSYTSGSGSASAIAQGHSIPGIHPIHHSTNTTPLSHGHGSTVESPLYGNPAGSTSSSSSVPKLPSFSELVTSIPLPNEFPLKGSTSDLGSPLPHSRQSSCPSLSNLSNTNTNTNTNLPSYYGSHFSSPTPMMRQNSASTLTSNHSVSPKTLLPTPPPSNIKEKESKRKHVCKVCSRSFTTSGHLARHNRIHTGERKHICPWPNCDARFARQDNCMQHYKTHTNGKKRKNTLNFKHKSINSKSI